LGAPCPVSGLPNINLHDQVNPADKLPGQHPNVIKEARSKAAIAIAREMSLNYRNALIGTIQQVLFEEPEGEYYTGHCPNYVKVYVSGRNLHNQIRNVRITALHGDGMLGELLENSSTID
jgi:threonylcarbamoyladenosine tRNA methylthiotransferase MtaB